MERSVTEDSPDAATANAGADGDGPGAGGPDGVTVELVEPDEVREQVVELMWEHRHWPGETREDYRRLWEWRYRALGDGPPGVRVARTTDGRVVGHTAVFPRTFRFGDRRLRGAVPGDILVHRDWRRHGIGVQLMLLPKQMVRRGDLDVVIVVGTYRAHEILVRLGFEELGGFHRHVRVLDSRPLLEGRLPRPALAAAAAPVVDGALGLAGWLPRRRVRSRAAGLEVVALDPDAVAGMDRSHWSFPADRLVGEDSPSYLVRRFLQDPHTRRELLALRDGATGDVEGHVVVEHDGGTATVCDCRVNADRLDEAAAISLAGERLSGRAAVYQVPALPGSDLAGRLRSLGFLHRSPVRPPGERVHVSAYWDPDLPFADALRGPEAWSLYTGAADA